MSTTSGRRGAWRVNEDGTATFLARVTNSAGTLITQASVSSILCTVTQQDADDETAADADATPYSDAPVISSTVYDTAQTSAVMWPSDEHPDGYNFRCAIPASAFPVGGVYYDVEFKFTMASATDDFGDSTQAVIVVPFRGAYTEPSLAT